MVAPCLVQGECCDYAGYKADPSSCCKYKVCDNCLEKSLSCPGGLHWNDKVKACDWPANAACATGSDVNEGLEEDPAPAPAETLELIESRSAGTVCECEGGDYTSGSECCKFKVCAGGQYVEMNCPAGLHWNDKVKACDWPCNADCKTA